ncbi:MAG TPA: HD domain-containing protein [Desulfatiglandales bacterium]|nr:HD domain-containing protein [Desulfatiglandales bacterium]
MVPSAEKCFELMERYGMPDNIKAHSIIVEKIAYIIARGNIDAGFNISIEKVIAGSLMHDIGKSLCLNSKADHAAKGREICIQNNLFEIADIVGEHIKLKRYEPEGAVMDGEIVYYADKRVNHDKVVSLDERLEYLLMRYANNKEIIGRLIKENFQECREVEKKLFARLNFRPEDLGEMIRQINKSP